MAEKGLEWKGVYIDILNGDQFKPEYIKINPKAVVPTLLHDDLVIPESTVICEYLDHNEPDTSLTHRIHGKTLRSGTGPSLLTRNCTRPVARLPLRVHIVTQLSVK